MVDIALPIRRLDPVFGHIGFGELEDRGFCVIYRDDGMEMVRHLHSCLRLGAQFRVGMSNARLREVMATMKQNGSSMIAATNVS
jgi:hypothetical protein